MSTFTFTSRSRRHYVPTSIAFLFLITLVNSQGLPEIISESYLRFSECTSFVNTCPPTRTSCASYICAQCTSVGYKAINSCCLQSDPAACLQTYVATADGGSVAVSSPAAQSSSVSLDAYGSACVSIENIFSTCQAQTPGFTNLADHDAASCLCYSGSSWVPNMFDDYAASCATFYNENSDASDASVFASNNNFCSSVGNIMGAASVSASTTASGSGSMVTGSSSMAQSASAAATPSSGGGSSPSTATQIQTSATGATSSSGAGNQKVPLGIMSLAWVMLFSVVIQVL